MPSLNVIWLMVDGIRNYPSPEKNSPQHDNFSDFYIKYNKEGISTKGTDFNNDIASTLSTAMAMGKPPIFEEIASEGIEFNNAITSALSTAMAISAQMMGLPSYFVSRNFKDFIYDNSIYETLSDILIKKGYQVYGISFAVDVRYNYKGLIKQVNPKFKPKGLKENLSWENDDVELIIDNVIEAGVKEPYFLFIHINGRRESDMNNRIKVILDKIKRLEGFSDSIFIVTSDHGIPDPIRRADYYHWMERNHIHLHKHDLVGTDDNILIPFILKYPGCEAQKIDTHVGSIDIVPTILDLLGYDFLRKYKEDIRGISLLPLIHGEDIGTYENRIIRSDARYLTQENNLVSLRGKRFKYIVAHNLPDRIHEVLYDLQEDPMETTNLIDSPKNIYQKILEEMRREYQIQEENAIRFHRDYLLHKFKKNFPIYSSITKESINNVCIFGAGNEAYLRIVLNICQICFPNASISTVTQKTDTELNFNDINPDIKQISIPDLVDKKAVKQATKDKSFDLILIMLNNRLGKGELKIIRSANVISSKQYILVDSNMDLSLSIAGIWKRIFKTKIKRRMKAYRRKPLEILVDIRKVLVDEVKY